MDAELTTLIELWKHKMKATKLYLEAVAQLNLMHTNGQLDDALKARGITWEEIKHLLNTD